LPVILAHNRDPFLDFRLGRNYHLVDGSGPSWPAFEAESAVRLPSNRRSLITGFTVSTSPSTQTAPNAPVMTDIELGNATAVPEPGGLMIAGMAAVSLLVWRTNSVRKRRRGDKLTV
jgi:hypothetical protein